MERLQELLATRATEGLPTAERDELGALLRSHADVDADALDLAAAEVYLELAARYEPAEQLPPDLRLRLVAEGHSRVRASLDKRELDERDNVTAFPTAAAAAKSAPSAMGWWAAAACLVLAVTGWWPRLTPTSPAPSSTPTTQTGTLPGETPPQPVQLTSAQMRGQLLENAADARLIAWTSTEDAAAAGADGDVVWSTARQQGFMRIRQLEANDPSAAQYQLWIFDAARDERYPVDGGVFDVPPDVEEIVVPIDVKVFVNEPALFAVTVEPPGGVVVSERERIVLVAQV